MESCKKPIYSNKICFNYLDKCILVKNQNNCKDDICVKKYYNCRSKLENEKQEKILLKN